MSLNVSVNGECKVMESINSPVLLTDLLESLEVRTSLVAIALNEDIVLCARWEVTMVVTGDRIEIVHFVGGGET